MTAVAAGAAPPVHAGKSILPIGITRTGSTARTADRPVAAVTARAGITAR